MPLEINEIAVMMNVRQPSGSANLDTQAEFEPDALLRLQNDLVDECVRRVLKALRAAEER